MSVYTTVPAVELSGFLARYDLGRLQGFVGVPTGIENTNYFVTTDSNELVLTLYEHHTSHALGYYFQLMNHLVGYGLPLVPPLPARDGSVLGALQGRPAALFARQAGGSPMQPTSGQCMAVGEALARWHLAARDFPLRRVSERRGGWLDALAGRLLPLLSGPERALLEGELAFQRKRDVSGLPGGVIHGDLFRDNVLFGGERLGSILDPYSACDDLWLYDLAVTVNDWCSGEDGWLLAERSEAVLAGYGSVRRLTAQEVREWPNELRAAALRFWLSRLQERYFPRPGELVEGRDPDCYLRILQWRREDAVQRRVM